MLMAPPFRKNRKPGLVLLGYTKFMEVASGSQSFCVDSPDVFREFARGRPPTIVSAWTRVS